MIEPTDVAGNIKPWNRGTTIFVAPDERLVPADRFPYRPSARVVETGNAPEAAVRACLVALQPESV